MMMFDEMALCGDMEYYCVPLGEKDVAASQAEPETIEEDYSDGEIDVDELERRMWRDKLRLKKLKEQNKGKEVIDIAKQCLKKLKEQNKGKEVIDIAKQRQSKNGRGER